MHLSKGLFNQLLRTSICTWEDITKPFQAAQGPARSGAYSNALAIAIVSLFFSEKIYRSPLNRDITPFIVNPCSPQSLLPLPPSCEYWLMCLSVCLSVAICVHTYMLCCFSDSCVRDTTDKELTNQRVQLFAFTGPIG